MITKNGLFMCDCNKSYTFKSRFCRQHRTVNDSQHRKSPAQYVEAFPEFITQPNRQDEYVQIALMTKAEARVLTSVGEVNQLNISWYFLLVMTALLEITKSTRCSCFLVQHNVSNLTVPRFSGNVSS